MRLHLYFARRFAISLLGVTGAFATILILLDLVEQLGEFAGDDLSFGQIVTLTLLNAPEGLYEILPLIVILATLSLFLSLARSSELVVTRAAGRSALRTIGAPFAVAALLGCVAVAALNPIVAATTERYRVLADRYQGKVSRALSVSEEGLWLRQGGPDGRTVIHAARSNPDGTVLSDVSFLGFDAQETPLWRVEAARARLLPGAWEVTDAKIWRFGQGANPERDAETSARLRLPSNLTPEQIRDSFGTPSSIPIWELPEFIDQLERAGFAARRHRVWLHTELAQPLLLAAMVVVAAVFTLRHTRFGRTGLMVLLALLMGFSFYFVRNFALVLGENGRIPVLLAAWGPPLATLLLPLGLLLHLEDG